MVFSPFLGFFNPSIDSSRKSFQVHSFTDHQLFSSRNFEVVAVNFSSLLPPLLAGKLPEGSECQVYGCALSHDDVTYYMIEGERCNISLSGETSVN